MGFGEDSPRNREIRNHARQRLRQERLLAAARKVLERLTRDDGASATGEFAKALERLRGAVDAYETRRTYLGGGALAAARKESDQ